MKEIIYYLILNVLPANASHFSLNGYETTEVDKWGVIIDRKFNWLGRLTETSHDYPDYNEKEL